MDVESGVYRDWVERPRRSVMDDRSDRPLQGRFTFTATKRPLTASGLDLTKRSVACDFIVATPRHFALSDSARKVISSDTWACFIDGDQAIYSGPGRAQLPSWLRQMVFPEVGFWDLAVDAVSRGEPTVTIDQQHRAVTEMRSESGSGRIDHLVELPADAAEFTWTGPVVDRRGDGRVAFVNAEVPAGVWPPVGGASSHLELGRIDGFAFAFCVEVAPDDLDFDAALAWAQSRSDRVIVEVDEPAPSQRRQHFSAGAIPVSGLPDLSPSTG